MRLILTTAISPFLAAWLAVCPPQMFGQQRPRPPAPALVEKIEEYMAARARVTGFSGAVLVAREGQQLYRRAFGDANREFAIANSTETKFRIGSVSK